MKTGCEDWSNTSLAAHLEEPDQPFNAHLAGCVIREAANRLRALDDKREPEERNHESTTDWYARNVCGHGDPKREAMDRAGECYSDGSEGCTASDRRVETMPVYGGYSNAEIMERIRRLEQHIREITRIPLKEDR